MKIEITKKKWFPYAIGIVAGFILATLFISPSQVSKDNMHEVIEIDVGFKTVIAVPDIKTIATR